MSDANNNPVSAARRLVERHPFAIALAVIGLLYVGPAWLFTHPPMDDYPAHLAMSQQLSEVLAGDPGPWLFAAKSLPRYIPEDQLDPPLPSGSACGPFIGSL